MQPNITFGVFFVFFVFAVRVIVFFITRTTTAEISCYDVTCQAHQVFPSDGRQGRGALRHQFHANKNFEKKRQNKKESVNETS